jgi:hypothetical protein
MRKLPAVPARRRRYNPRRMRGPLVLGPLLAALSACSSAPPPERLPERAAPGPEQRARPDEIVAFYNGEGLTWQAVAEKTLELNLKESVDQYVRWRIVEDRRAALSISHTPAELRRRAAVYLDQAKKSMGEERFRQQLQRENATEESKIAQIEQSRFLSQMLTLDKIVRYAELIEDRLEIDRAYFVDEAEARRFHERCGAKGFDAASQELLPERKPTKGRLPKETFPKAQPPSDPPVDPWIVDELLRLPEGGVTGVETSRSNLYYVIRLRGLRKGRDVVYSQVKDELLEGILKDPPAQQDYARWMEREMARCKVEYAEGGARREGKGGSR